MGLSAAGPTPRDPLLPKGVPVSISCDRKPKTRRAPVWLGALVLLFAMAARGDHVQVKGVTLEGRVVEVTSTHVHLETVYGDGVLQIPLENVEGIETEEPMHIVWGDGGDTVGHLVEVSEEAIQVRAADATESISVDDIFPSVPQADFEESLAEQLDSRWRYWNGTFDFGFSSKQATDDTLNLTTALELVRKKDPNTISFFARYDLETEQKQGQSSNKLTNETFVRLRGTREMPLVPRTYLWGSTDALNDPIESLSVRSVTGAGLGYHLIEHERGKLDGEIGPGYTYERFHGGDENDRATMRFALLSEVDLGFGTWDGFAEYIPAVNDWTDNYLIRAETGVRIPITDILAFRFSLREEYDSQPAEGSKSNTLETRATLSVGF
jgi:putative salt-induced outer membrane protein YdiY